MDEHTTDVQKTGALPVTGVVPPTPARDERPAWVQDVLGGLPGAGRYLAYEDGGRHVVLPIEREWTRIGRSLAADVRFDDATVSRRHALVVSQQDGVRVLDDRSLNGVYVNGRRVEWSPLTDGDAISIGRHTLYFLDAANIQPPVAAAPAAAD